MRIRVLVPGAEFLSTAGARIRYHRIAPHLERLGHSITLQLIDEFRPRQPRDCDVVLVSKCYDARAILVANEMRAQGVAVGADFFDDYYSQTSDSRFVHLRRWLHDIAPLLDFALCSTERMRETLAGLVPHLPCHQMNDPYEEVDAARLAERVETKLKRAASSGVLDIGWFGIGDNPHFDVGLTDLVAQSGGLADLQRHGFSPRLSIITNRRALGVDRLQMLAGLPLPWRLEEWSEEAERRLIERSYVCFLPVNCQRFSIAKSLNRAVTALTGGAQVLSAGYPLYDLFSDFLYRDVRALAADIAAGKPRLRRNTLPAFAAAMDQHASPAAETAALAAFLAGLGGPSAQPAQRPLAILHGRTSAAAVHKFAQSNGYLSAAGFKPAANLNYDVKPVIDAATGLPLVQIMPAALKMLAPSLARQARPYTSAAGRACHALPLPDGFPLPATAPPATDSDAVAVAEYAADMADLRRLMAHLFGDIEAIVSEPASPFWEGPAPGHAP